MIEQARVLFWLGVGEIAARSGLLHIPAPVTGLILLQDRRQRVGFQEQTGAELADGLAILLPHAPKRPARKRSAPTRYQR